jgi:hypothetical protein
LHTSIPTPTRVRRARKNYEDIEEVLYDEDGNIYLRYEDGTSPTGHYEGSVFVVGGKIPRHKLRRSNTHPLEAGFLV